MSEYCTIFGAKRHCAAALDRLQQMPSHGLEIVGEKARWKTLLLRGKTATLAFTSMERQEPGDEFSRLILSTHDFFRKIGATEKSKQEAVLRAIGSSTIVVGVVADPAFVEEEGHFECVLDVARILDGLIFNGTAMLDSEGNLLLDQEGRSGN